MLDEATSEHRQGNLFRVRHNRDIRSRFSKV